LLQAGTDVVPASPLARSADEALVGARHGLVPVSAVPAGVLPARGPQRRRVVGERRSVSQAGGKPRRATRELLSSRAGRGGEPIDDMRPSLRARGQAAAANDGVDLDALAAPAVPA